MIRIAALALAVLTATAIPANAQGYHRPHHGYGHGGGGWIAPFVGGAIIGGVLGGVLAAPSYAPPPVVYAPAPAYVPTCWDEVRYDSWNRPYYQRICR